MSWTKDARMDNRLEMIDQPGQHCVKYLETKLNQLSKMPDPEDIRRLTRGMKREHWKPTKLTADGIIREFLEAFKDCGSHELERFGVDSSAIRRFCMLNPEVKVHRRLVDKNTMLTYYSLGR